MRLLRAHRRIQRQAPDPGLPDIVPPALSPRGGGSSPGFAMFGIGLQDAPAHSDARRMRILIVEDDPSVRRLLSVQLGLAGHETHIAEDGAAALLEVGRQRPDVVLLDVMMPVLDGWQVLE